MEKSEAAEKSTTRRVTVATTRLADDHWPHAGARATDINSPLSNFRGNIYDRNSYKTRPISSRKSGGLFSGTRTKRLWRRPGRCRSSNETWLRAWLLHR